MPSDSTDSVPARMLKQFQALNIWVRVGAGVGAIAVVALLVFSLTSGSGGPEEVVVREQTPTPTASPTPTATASPTPTATPEWPIPADPIPLGEPAGLVNATSIGMPPAPASDRIPPGNEAGVARIVSPALGMDNYVSTLAIVDGQMQSPDEDGNHEVGWYAPDGQYKLGTPGEAGNSVLSAHETWQHMQGPFYLLHEARPGDDIYLEMTDGERRHYQVARVTRYPLSSMPMREVLWPSDRPEGEEWLTLYTCGGEIIYGASGYGEYLERDVLVAKWVGSEFPDDAPASGDGGNQAATDTGAGSAASMDAAAQ